MIVTLDGPAGSGKSTAARRLADRLGFVFLDTGAMYRAVAYCCLEAGLSLDDEAAIAELADSLSLVLDLGRVIANGADVTQELRSVEVTVAASRVATNQAVRDRLVKLQRAAAIEKNLVTEGRDQGTVVFPDAQCKFFLTAQPKERARRRLRELEDQGHPVDLQEVLQQILERDKRDATREVAPLKAAADAILIDTTSVGLEEILDGLEQTVREKMAV